MEYGYSFASTPSRTVRVKTHTDGPTSVAAGSLNVGLAPPALCVFLLLLRLWVVAFTQPHRNGIESSKIFVANSKRISVAVAWSLTNPHRILLPRAASSRSTW